MSSFSGQLGDKSQSMVLGNKSRVLTKDGGMVKDKTEESNECLLK